VSDGRPDERDQAITELAHVARSLLDGVIEQGEMPKSVTAALRNKIEHYAALAAREDEPLPPDHTGTCSVPLLPEEKS
jgi:hypothetical protein